VESSEIEETGEYDLEGLFIRLGSAVDSIGAKRVVLDTIEVLFSGFKDEAILRSELRRLFRWIKDRGLTAIVTGERGENTLNRYGLEEYVADCVILLDARMTDQIATRRLRVVKYRGSRHGTNEYPFLIEDNGISVAPITSLGLAHEVSNERVSTGIERLDTMLGDAGYYRGSSILISGTAGTGKTSFAAHFVDAACRRGERCLYFAFEESPSQIVRNMRSIGIDMDPRIKAGLLTIHSSRPMTFGLENHLVEMRKLVDKLAPQVVVIDPISNLTNVGTTSDVKFMLTRLIDSLKTKGITTFCTSLVDYEANNSDTAQGISSLMDTWIRLNFMESDNERNRGLSVVKSRGMAHSNQVREFMITDHGIELKDVYLGPAGGLLMGSARASQEAREVEDALAREQEIKRRRREIERNLKALRVQMAVLNEELETESYELKELNSKENLLIQSGKQTRNNMARIRKADSQDVRPAK
jgi:circadian clock protein KaiC